MLLAHGADPNVKESLRGQTALMWAAGEGHSEAIKALHRARRRPPGALQRGLDAAAVRGAGRTAPTRCRRCCTPAPT